MQTDLDPQAGQGYTAVVYAHGMGSQRRFQEIGRLIDALDTYQHRAFTQRNESLGRLMAIRAREETWQEQVKAENGVSGQIPFVQVIYKATPESPGNQIRFYEIYWADRMAGSGVLDVLKWIGLQSLRPFRWWGAPWRSFHRQRRSVLAEMYEQEIAAGAVEWPGDYDHLLDIYDRFDGLAAKRTYPAGDFAEFLQLVEARCAGHPDRAKRLTALAWRWRAAGRKEEWHNAGGILSLLVAIAVALIGLIWAATQVVEWLRATLASDSAGPRSLLSLLPEPTVGAMAGIVGWLVLSFGLGAFLKRSIADVAAWTTYAEAEKGHEERKAVLSVGCCVLQQVLLDPDCSRVVVVGHSLGTSVACDTVLALARANRVRASRAGPEPLKLPLERLSHLVTLASPIDKIAYFFESHVASHRFARVLESLRGDLGDAPFTQAGQTGMRWINFWDAADPISGPLHSQISRHGMEPRVENIHVSSLSFPLPGTAHSAYFENRKVIGTLFDVIFRPEQLSPRPVPGPSPFGLGDSGRRAQIIYWIMLSVPWLFLLALVGQLAGSESLYRAAGLCGVLLALGLAAVFLLRGRTKLDPL